MTNDPYRDDRAALLARIAELEGQLERFLIEGDPLAWVKQCPYCGTKNYDGSTSSGRDNGNKLARGKVWAGWTYPETCSPDSCGGFWACLLCRLPNPHLHQHCTACNGWWAVSRNGLHLTR